MSDAKEKASPDAQQAKQKETESSGLRQRKPAAKRAEESDRPATSSADLVGKTANGQTFPLPPLKDPFKLPTRATLRPGDALQYGTGVFFLIALLPIPDWTVIAMFLFWRLAYNLGLGVLLHAQSSRNSLVLAYKRAKQQYPVLRRLVEGDQPKGFKFDSYPDEFIAWLVFRRLVDVVLAADVVCYFALCFRFFEVPADGITFTVVLQYFVGLLLSAFALWSKSDAYRVIGSFAWYWGDFFFLVPQELQFDRVFGIAPHPMYTLGYSFFYGMSLICHSYVVFLVSLVAHGCQMLFLLLVENPHIEKTYNTVVSGPDEAEQAEQIAAARGYLRRDLIVFKNFNPYRSSDVMAVVLVTLYASLLLTDLHYSYFVYAAVLARAIHSGALGIVLARQSRFNAWIEGAKAHGIAKADAFESWKRLYNLSLIMCHTTFVCVVLHHLEPSTIVSSLREFTCAVIGLVFVFLNVWCSTEVYSSLGDFGWFYGDFFLTDVPAQLQYSGIYRYVNNPENVLGYAGYYGMAIATTSWHVFFLALFCHASNYLFVYLVETPHIRRKYGGAHRPQAGVQITLNEIINEAIESNENVKRLATSVKEALKNPPNDSLKMC